MNRDQALAMVDEALADRAACRDGEVFKLLFIAVF
jgi:hypothetical protein